MPAQQEMKPQQAKTLQIEIWSDVVCPFCYIGKRKLESALRDLDPKTEIRLEWRSFLLDESVISDSTKSIYEHLAERKGWTIEEAKRISLQVAEMAGQEGLIYNFDHVRVANSQKAHQLIQLAKSKGKGAEAEELLFEAYFTKGLQIDQKNTLQQIGQQLGIQAAEIEDWIGSEKAQLLVKQDIQAANELGINAVPYFIFNRKVAVSGAQHLSVFKTAIEKAMK